MIFDNRRGRAVLDAIVPQADRFFDREAPYLARYNWPRPIAFSGRRAQLAEISYIVQEKEIIAIKRQRRSMRALAPRESSEDAAQQLAETQTVWTGQREEARRREYCEGW